MNMMWTVRDQPTEGIFIRSNIPAFCSTTARWLESTDQLKEGPHHIRSIEEEE